uniref:Uncharacterized protein n=1 Tax=Trichogramma kaykai TaxID=54128 RepID=A0ABD2VUH2_9HYME
MNAPPSNGPSQDLRLDLDSETASDDERYLRFRAERLSIEHLPPQRLRSVVVIPPGSGLNPRNYEDQAYLRHPTRPELSVPPARAPRAESPGLRQPIARRPRGRSLSPYLRENPPIPLHLHRTIKLRLEPSVSPRPRPRIRTPPRSPEVPVKRHFGLAFVPAALDSPAQRPSTFARLGPPVASPQVSTTLATSDPPIVSQQANERQTTRASQRQQRNYKRSIAQKLKKAGKK